MMPLMMPNDDDFKTNFPIVAVIVFMWNFLYVIKQGVRPCWVGQVLIYFSLMVFTHMPNIQWRSSSQEMGLEKTSRSNQRS